MMLADNEYQYNQILVEKDITFYSNCKHHFVPFFGKVHLAYILSDKVIGSEDVMVVVVIEAGHLRVSSRGIKDDSSSTITYFYGGKFKKSN